MGRGSRLSTVEAQFAGLEAGDSPISGRRGKKAPQEKLEGLRHGVRTDRGPTRTSKKKLHKSSRRAVVSEKNLSIINSLSGVWPLGESITTQSAGEDQHHSTKRVP